MLAITDQSEIPLDGVLTSVALDVPDALRVPVRRAARDDEVLDLARDLLLEDRLENHRTGAGLLALLHALGGVRETRTPDDDRVAELEAHVLRGEVCHLCLLCVLSV